MCLVEFNLLSTSQRQIVVSRLSCSGPEYILPFLVPLSMYGWARKQPMREGTTCATFSTVDWDLALSCTVKNFWKQELQALLTKSYQMVINGVTRKIDEVYMIFNSLRSSDVFMRYKIKHSLVQILAALYRAIIWTNAGVLSSGPPGTNLNEIWIKIQNLNWRIYLWKCHQTDGHFDLGLNT